MNSRNNGLLRLKHLRETSEAKRADMAELSARFDRLKGQQTRAVSSFNLFQTPPELAARVAGLIPIRGRILEPSAGLGRLYKAARAVNDIDPITLVELSPDCAGELYRETAADSYAQIIQADFLDCDAVRLGGLFDSVLMNPPFCRGTDVKHVKHAAECFSYP